MKMHWLAASLGTLLVATAAQAQEVVQWAAPAPQSGHYSYFPMGTPLQLTTRTVLTTRDNHAGDRFYLEVAEPLVYHGQTVVPAGAVAVGEVIQADRSAAFGKKGQLAVRLLYVQTPSGPVRLSGRLARNGTDQGLLAIGGGAVIAWPMFFIHGTSGRLPADSNITAYLADDLRFPVSLEAERATVAAMPDAAPRVLPARFDPAVFALNRP